MVRVERVAAGFAPPLDEHFAWIEVAVDEAAFFEGTLADIAAGRFTSNNNPVDIANAIIDASAWAKARGATVVYVTQP